MVLRSLTRPGSCLISSAEITLSHYVTDLLYRRVFLTLILSPKRAIRSNNAPIRLQKSCIVSAYSSRSSISICIDS
jgi:hypothetical protein